MLKLFKKLLSIGPRILIVNVNWFGDVLFSTPAIRAIRMTYPDSTLVCLVPPRCADILKNNPYLNEVMVVHDRVSFYAWFEHLRIILQIRKYRFDTAIFFHRSKTKVWWTWAAGVRERAGYQAPGRTWLLTRACPKPAAPMHKIDYFLNLLKFLGISHDGRAPDFYPCVGARSELEELLKINGLTAHSPYAVMHVGGNWNLKRWPESHFVEWAKRMLKKYSWRIILCGTLKEETLANRIGSHFENKEVISFCGKTSIDTLALLLKNAQVVLSNDSGPIHLAASQGAKIVGLFGPTSPDLTGPVSRGLSAIQRKDVGCEIPCYYRSCDHRICMDWLTPEEVFENTVKLLEEK